MSRTMLSLFFLGALSAIASCTKVDIEVVDVGRVEGYASTQYLAEDSMAWTPREQEFVRIDFETRPSLEEIAREPGMQLSYDFHACDAPEQWSTGGNIFPHPTKPGVYRAYVPAHFSNLSFWVTGGGSGQIGRGWPDELVNERLCLKVQGGVPYANVLYSPPAYVPGVGRLFIADGE